MMFAHTSSCYFIPLIVITYKPFNFLSRSLSQPTLQKERKEEEKYAEISPFQTYSEN